MRKVVIMLLSGLICLLGIAPVLAQTWATPEEYEKATGKRIEEFQEAPELRVLVAAGELPPVEERLPQEPLVILGFDGEVGKYGGILNIAEDDVGLAVSIQNGTSLILARHSFTVDPYANLAKSYEMRDDGREWIVELRKGLKWSDGMAFTADDILFWYEDVILNEEITPALPSTLRSGDQVVKIEKIDEYTLRFGFAVPTDLITKGGMFYWMTRYPKHYLRQFHPNYVDKNQLDETVKEMEFDTWFQLFIDKADENLQRNMDKPTLEPWVLVQSPPDNPVIWRRNPYYWAVDPAGNQLPYIDERRITITGSTEVTNLKVLAGEMDFYWREAGVDMYILGKKEEGRGKIKAFRWSASEINAAQVEFNLTHADPVIRKIFQDKRFRFAVSHAIDREMINQLVYAGVCDPWQVAPLEGSPFYNERLAHTALEYNLEEANELLDEMGLDKRDANGFRLRPDGKPLLITFISYPVPGLPAIGEIVMDNLKAVGLNSNLRFVDFGFLLERRGANAHDAALIWESWGTNEGAYIADGQANHFVPINAGINFWSPLWSAWYGSDGEEGEEPIPVMLEALDYFKKAQNTLDPEEQKEWFKKVLDIAADNLWTIGTVKHPGYPVLVNVKLRNVPTTMLPWYRGDFGRPDVWFYQD